MVTEYELREEDVFVVLREHGKAEEVDDILVADYFDLLKAHQERIEEVALYGESEEEQTMFALGEIEIIMVEMGWLEGEAYFTP